MQLSPTCQVEAKLPSGLEGDHEWQGARVMACCLNGRGQEVQRVPGELQACEPGGSAERAKRRKGKGAECLQGKKETESTRARVRARR